MPTKQTPAKAAEPKKDPRAERWAKLVEAYAIANPVKYAAKKAAGHFDKIPDSFQ